MKKFYDNYDALDSFVNCDMDWEDRKEAEKLIKQDLDKLSKLENLEEELGCPLDIFVSIMLGKIDEIVINYAGACGYEPLYEELTLAKVDGIIDGYIHNCLCIDTNMCEVPVKDYHKNWWLRGEKDEAEKTN